MARPAGLALIRDERDASRDVTETAGAQATREASGAPCRTRTCDLLVRSQEKGGNTGQRETAALFFFGRFANLGQLLDTASSA